MRKLLGVGLCILSFPAVFTLGWAVVGAGFPGRDYPGQTLLTIVLTPFGLLGMPFLPIFTKGVALYDS